MLDWAVNTPPVTQRPSNTLTFECLRFLKEIKPRQMKPKITTSYYPVPSAIWQMFCKLISHIFRWVKQQQNMGNEQNICQYCTLATSYRRLIDVETTSCVYCVKSVDWMLNDQVDIPNKVSFKNNYLQTQSQSDLGPAKYP